MPDPLSARFRELLRLVDPRCDCPRCDLGAYQKALSEHLVAAGPGYHPEHLRASWEKPTRRPGTRAPEDDPPTTERD